MAEHSAEVTVNAPLHQVYQLYTHFNDYPKFMTFVKEVTYLDDKRSHWVVDIVGRHEWDAVNENWIPDEQIGWRSVDGLANSGRVAFRDLAADRTAVLVTVSYVPPAGLLGNIGEALGAGNTFEQRLQHDLEHFAPRRRTSFTPAARRRAATRRRRSASRWGYERAPPIRRLPRVRPPSANRASTKRSTTPRCRAFRERRRRKRRRTSCQAAAVSRRA